MPNSHLHHPSALPPNTHTVKVGAPRSVPASNLQALACEFTLPGFLSLTTNSYSSAKPQKQNHLPP